MAYPETGAKYRNEPKWLKRAEGGEVGGPESTSDPRADLSPMAVEEKGRTIPMSQRDSMMQNEAIGIGQGAPIFPVDPNKDNLVSGAAKIMAEPYAETARDLYHRM